MISCRLLPSSEYEAQAVLLVRLLVLVEIFFLETTRTFFYWFCYINGGGKRQEHCTCQKKCSRRYFEVKHAVLAAY
jgi:hypothetical protein